VEHAGRPVSVGTSLGTGRRFSGPVSPERAGRQFEVLELLASGKSARHIGTELYLSQATARNHTRALLQGLGAHSQLEALAREFGLLAP
jgi:DNA-binding NarL/FixJ family response regulator